ncbi:MAG: metallophosphoesterase family protein [Actinomycetota bacterium]
MSIYVISDLHGAADAIPKAVPEGSTLLLLGDLLNVIDYAEMSGILVDIFSVDDVAEVVQLRTEGRVEEAQRIMHSRSAGREQEIRDRFGALAAAQYEEIFAHLPDPTHLILGNVDIPNMAAAFIDSTPAANDADTSVIELEGERFGFAGGALPTPLHIAGEITEEEMRAKIQCLPEVDVLCSHIPPAIPELCWDTLAKRSERGSQDLLEYINDVQPRRHYFGHVHQPLVSSMSIGRTVCVNVGYFRATKRAFPHRREA